MKPITARNWPKQRPKLSVQFDMNCHKVACALLALQSRELMAMQQQKAGTLNQRSMLQMAQSIRKIQEVGRMALGETTDRQQLDLDFDPPDIRLMVIDGQIQVAGD